MPCYDCLYCGALMASKEDGRRHLQKECQAKPSWEWVCMYCGLEFEFENGLNKHIARWCNDKPTEMEFCSKLYLLFYLDAP